MDDINRHIVNFSLYIVGTMYSEIPTKGARHDESESGMPILGVFTSSCQSISPLKKLRPTDIDKVVAVQLQNEICKN